MTSDRSLATLRAAQLLCAVAGAVIAAYLTVIRLGGDLPACGPLRGCETVALSDQSTISGVPVAVLGLAFSVTLLLVVLRSIQRPDDRRFVLLSYGMGLFGTAFVSYLTFVEVFVIHAICVWCAAYAATVVGGLALAALRLRRLPRTVAGSPSRPRPR